MQDFITFLGSSDVDTVHATTESTIDSQLNMMTLPSVDIGTTAEHTTVTAGTNTTTAANLTTTPLSNHTSTPSNWTSTTPTSTTPVFSSTTFIPWSNLTIWSLSRGKHFPDLRILVISPAWFFIITAMLRSVRQMGIISAIANAAILAGCVEVFAFLLTGKK